jgi:hypothetical protein
MRLLSIMTLMVVLGMSPAIAADMTAAKDDGGFGSARFSAKAPSALGGDAMPSVAIVPPENVEPASGEEDITPEEESLDNVQKPQNVEQHSDGQSETYTIHKDLNVR